MDYNNKIGIVSVNEIQGMDFMIPNYQRGYRWEELQVRELLKDLHNFIKSPTSGFYCLQPLVVKRSVIDKSSFYSNITTLLSSIKDETDPIGCLESNLQRYTSWEVIDGQQRLTTLYIILMVLKNHVPYNLRYQTRPDSKKFLENIMSKSTEDGDKNIDFKHMFMAREEVVSWLNDKSEEDKSMLYDTILEKVKFIWYESIGEDPIDVFTRLNIGKISLTNAELIKAALLNKSNYTNLHEDIIRTKQIQIATKWDEIEYALQDDEFWLFLNDKNSKELTRIDFIFKILFENDCFDLKSELTEEDYEDQIGNDRYSVYRYFAKKIEMVSVSPSFEDYFDKIWEEVTALYDTLREWYNDPLLYHYIGYIIWSLEDDKKGPKDRRKEINKWYKSWRLESSDKKAFLQKIKNEIRDNIIGKSSAELKKLHYEKNKSLIRKVLLLHNVQTVISQHEIQDDKYKLSTFYKFPFHLFKKEVWNVEHIDSATTNDLSKTKDQKSWIRAAIADGKLKYDDERIKRFLSLKDKETIEGFQDIYEEVMKKYPSDNLLNECAKSPEGDEVNERMLIWNLALLDEGTNKSYHNSIFSVKRSFVIYKEQGVHCYLSDKGEVETDTKRAIAFVPICTKQAFMKYYTSDANALLAWTRGDAEKYRDDIIEKLTDFLRK